MIENEKVEFFSGHPVSILSILAMIYTLKQYSRCFYGEDRGSISLETITINSNRI